MEKLMMLYLNESYPNTYLVKSKFGEVLYQMNEGPLSSTSDSVSVMRYKVVEQLENLFCCSNYMAEVVYYHWFHSRPLYERVTNSTNGYILVPTKTTCNTTL